MSLNPMRGTLPAKGGDIIRAVIYTRFSPRKDADESLSCEKQKEICVEYCRKMKYNVDLATRYFEDKAMSGDDGDRPGLWLAVAELRRTDILVVRWRHRLARDVYLSEVIRRSVNSAGASIEAAEGSTNGDDPDTVMIQQILAAFAERERKIICMRTKHAMRRYMRQGRIMGPSPPFGWQVNPLNPRMMVRNEGEQKIIAVMLRLREEGFGWLTLGKELDMLGLLPRSGGLWNKRSVSKIIKREQEWAALGGSEV